MVGLQVMDAPLGPNRRNSRKLNDISSKSKNMEDNLNGDILISSDDDRALITDESPTTPSTEEDTIDAYMRDYEKLGSTPPRTRILRRDRSKEQMRSRSRHRHSHRQSFNHERLLSKVINGGKKYLNAQLSLLGPWEIDGEGEIVEQKKRMSKRTMQRIRGTERDLKLDIAAEKEVPKTPLSEIDIMPARKVVESSNRFLSLSCKLVKTAIQWRAVSTPEGGKNRNDFYDNFSALVKSGNDKEKPCKRQLSREEHLWQTELKDMIWLELQAWRADNTPTQQDKYLCDARQAIPQLLVDILNYRFDKTHHLSQSSSQSNDSGILMYSESEAPCDGCFWLFCPTCIEIESNALKEVEVLLNRLENAEALYPSSKAFANQYPMYRSDEFTGRVKAMCLWYNIMRHHRLKLIILGRQLLSYAEGNDPDKSQFLGSENSENYYHHKCDFYNTQPLQSLGRYFHHIDSSDTRTYRKFIEDVLKIRGLRKALLFLEHLYLKVLKKARLAMEKPVGGLIENNDDSEGQDENELRRFGYWSSESQSLNLPSFRPAFLFISRIPLDVIHEFLRLRLETKLENPSALSIRQLIKELKEGLKLAVLNKQRYLQHCEIALADVDDETKSQFKDYVLSFDESVKSVLELYLSYTERWVMLTQHERLQKNILEEEWKFLILTAPLIPGGEALAGKVFCNIASSMLKTISTQLKSSLNDLKDNFAETDDELFCPNSQSRISVLPICRDLQMLYVNTREKSLRVLSLTKTLIKHLESEAFELCATISSALEKLKGSVFEMCSTLKETVSLVQDTMLAPYFDDNNLAVQSRCREVLHTIYKFTFEYYKEIGRFSTHKNTHAKDIIAFAQQWIRSITTYCEKGRGVRPRWANYGLEFLVYVTDPKFTTHLTDKEFEAFRKDIERCVSHIMGSATTNSSISQSPSYTSMPRSASPSPTVIHGKLSFSSLTDYSSSTTSDSEGSRLPVPEIQCLNPSKAQRVKDAIKKLDEDIDKRLKNAELIGTVMVTSTLSNEKHYIRPRSVNFSWQRGIKIGQGRFGKVYTAVNTETGELMAMKEISLQPNDVRTIRKVALEFKIFEGIQHDHLVRYYGAEVHREELLIFMQLCTEGTLESLVAATEIGLPEALVRRYTSQLVSAISTLHMHSIVHRDIKPANIFLTAEGNKLKLGDFGSAVKIKAHTTVPGELKGFVGTQAYMAPEVFMKSNTSGHGRAADIWSLGCVVIEMASGKRPWSEFDSNYQIMFKVGMGETPELPPSISEEGSSFISQCIQHNPKQRATTAQLEHHTFLKIESEEECLFFSMPSLLEDYLKLGIKR